MTQRDNILQELKELESPLAVFPQQNVFEVPKGYFDDLATIILNRAKATDAASPEDEINFLSPFLGKALAVNPYSVPNGYFESLEERLKTVLHEANKQTAKEELEELSPLLSGLKKQNPYSIPQGYFDNLNIPATQEEAAPPAKVISMGSRKWFRYVAAAVVIGFVTVGTLLVLNKQETINPATNSYAWIKKNLNKVSTEEIDSFVTIAGKVTPVIAANEETSEVKDLMKNISDKEIQEFLNDTDISEPDSDEDLFLN